MSCAVLPSQAFSFPLEKFDHKLEVTCAADPSCARSLRAKTTLGAYTGIWIRGGDEMRSHLSVSKGRLEVRAAGPLIGGIQLSWDSDTYADQLSSAGLKCIDIRHEGGTAIVIEDFELKGRCGADSVERECPPFVVETRIYDSADPTGQTYSASILRRANGRESQDLIIPFSNFNRKGLRGEGRLGCAGAVSINVRTDGYREVTLNAGPIFTNSNEPFEALVLTPTPTALSATPTMIGGGTEVTPSKPTNAPLVDNAATPIPPESAVELPSVTTGVDEESVMTPRPPSASEVVVAPLNSPEPEEEVVEETVYGAIVRE